MSELIRSSNRFLSEFEAQINQEYGRISEKIKRGIVRSIAFLIVTKFVIGILIEIPYDRMMHGEILWLPLAINLFFPPVYMMILSMMLPMPGEANTRALTDKIDEIIYGSNNKRIIVGRNGKQFNIIFKIVYALLFLIVFGSATWILVQLQFSVLHLAIFFIFLSTASFLGFRLTRVVSEIEVVGSDQSALTVIRDVFYMPFVVVGHWISDKYGKMNIMTMILDMAIELPLKSFLKLVRQWSAFISSQKDEL